MLRLIPRAVPAATLAIAATMLAGAVAAQEDLSDPGPGVLGEVLPTEVSGLPLDPMELPLEFLLVDADPSDPDQAAGIEAVESFAESQGVGIEELVLGNASAFDLDTSLGVFVSGMRTTDTGAAPDVEAFVELMVALDPTLSPLDLPLAVEPAQIEGRDVLLVSPEPLLDGVFDATDHVGVSSGGYALLLQGDPEFIGEIVAALPEEPEGA